MEEWIDVNPTSGTGNGKFNVGGTPNTGRDPRHTTLLVNAEGGEKHQKIPVTQEAKKEFVSFGCMQEIIISSEGGELYVQGMTNTPKLTFNLSESNMDAILHDKYDAGGELINNGEKIPLDPGTHDAFRFCVALTINENITQKELCGKLCAVADNNSCTTLILKQKQFILKDLDIKK
ncbi:MAG: BACON domain-containing protein [Prevotellaceae bacterium]|jgi:hypothetical protein|nr:BACON domain-containing protein [Prevotellaceae bacterium]